MQVCLECENSLTVHLGFVHFSVCTYNLLSFLKIITKRLEFLEFGLNSFSSGFATNVLPNNFHTECGLWRRRILWGRAFGATRQPQACALRPGPGEPPGWCFYLRRLPGAWSTAPKSPDVSRGDSATDCSRRPRRPDPARP